MNAELEALRQRVVEESLDVLRREAQDRENDAYVAERLNPRWGVAQQAAEAREMSLQRRETQR